MKSIFSNSTLIAFSLGSLALLWGATACGTATSTRAPNTTTATLIAVAPATATVATTPTVAASPTVTPTVAITATALTKVAQFVTPTTARAATRTATPKGAVPAPGGLTGRIAFSVRFPGADYVSWQVWVSNADGGSAHMILERARWPAFSPDGKQIAYFERDTGLRLADQEGGHSRAVVNGAGICCYGWSPDGRWIAYTDSVRFNQITGPIKKIKVETMFNYGNQEIRDLGVQGVAPEFSPDGKQIVYGGCLTNSSTCGIFVIGAEGGNPRVLSTDLGGNPHWSPRGDKIVYHAGIDGRLQVFIVNADGKDRKQLTSGKGNDGQPIFSRDGTRIFYRTDQDGTEWAIYTMNLDGSGKKKLLTTGPADPDFWGWDSLSVAP